MNIDLITLILIIFAVAGGIGVGFVIARRRSLESLAHSTLSRTTIPGDTMSNLLMFLGDPTEPRILLERASEWLRIELNLPLVVIYPFDSANQELIGPVHSGKGGELPPRYRLNSSIWGEVAGARSAARFDNLATDPRFSSVQNMTDAYIIPLVAESTLIGVIGLFAATADTFTPERLHIIDQFGGLIAVQAMVARRFMDSRQAIERFDRFQRLSQQLVTQLDLQDLLQPIVSAAREMLDTQMSILLEIRDNDDRLHPVAWSGITDETALMLESRLKEDLKGLVGWARLPARTHNLRTDQRTARATQAVVAGMASELAAPVLYADKLYGVLAVETNVHRNFSDEESNLLQSLAAQVGIALRNAQLYTRVKNTNQQLEQSLSDLHAAQAEIARAHQAEIHAYESELETARQIQTSLLPIETPPVAKIVVAARNIPARHVSGDFYQYFLLPGGKLGVAIGDVSGKGIPAALLMAVTTTALRDEIVQATSVTTVLNELNLRLFDRMQSTSMNSALCMAVFDPETGYTELANAGMVQPYLWRTATNIWEGIEIGGYPLGASKRTKYVAQSVILTPGAMILMVSDGVIECQNTKGELFGFERFERLLSEMPRPLTPEKMIDFILSAVSQFAEGYDYQDDVTILIMKAT